MECVWGVGEWSVMGVWCGRRKERREGGGGCGGGGEG